ncbi:MAG: hypothetical protein K8H88_17795 [Sandaracinaceae bacterium]|nr:hypothetical protein [Sandaracinaceae bacterium]
MMRALLVALLFCCTLPAAAQDRAPRRARVLELPEQRVFGRRASFVFVPRARDRYEAPPLVRRDLPREVVRSVRHDCF